jgi:hypothetical protein
MKKTNITVLILILIVLTLLLSMASSAFAHEEPQPAVTDAVVDPPKVRDWILRFGIVVADTNGSTSVLVDPGSVEARLSGGGGGFANIEYAFLPWFGLEFGTTTIGSDVNVSTGVGQKHIGTSVDVLGMSALTLGANFRFVRTPTVNLYAGPMVSFNRYSQWSTSTGIGDGCWPTKHDCDDWVRLDSRNDSEVTWGAKVGIDIVLTKRGNWALSGALSYIDASYNFDQADGGGRGSIAYDPLMFSFGGGFRW